VAIDKDGNPSPVPCIIPETDDEKRVHQSAPIRTAQQRERQMPSREFAEIFGTDYPWNQ
jgi:acyl-CoA hydrolase